MEKALKDRKLCYYTRYYSLSAASRSEGNLILLS